jgi:Fe2+ or Zn2+ uptake regulation protein
VICGATQLNTLTSLQRLILQYVAEHKQAAETTVGVTRVWLKRAPGARQIAKVERALEELVEAGWMEKHALPDANIVYRSARDAAAEPAVDSD